MCKLLRFVYHDVNISWREIWQKFINIIFVLYKYINIYETFIFPSIKWIIYNENHFFVLFIFLISGMFYYYLRLWNVIYDQFTFVYEH